MHALPLYLSVSFRTFSDNCIRSHEPMCGLAHFLLRDMHTYGFVEVTKLEKMKFHPARIFDTAFRFPWAHTYTNLEIRLSLRIPTIILFFVDIGKIAWGQHPQIRSRSIDIDRQCQHFNRKRNFIVDCCLLIWT